MKVLFLLLIFGFNCIEASWSRFRAARIGWIERIYNRDSGHRELWFDQKLDHFNPADQRMWRQRYFVNDSYFDHENPGPVFLMLGGEGDIDGDMADRNETWLAYAKRFKALCLELEHRFYGKSQPFNNSDYFTLSSRQALADAAYFLEMIRGQYNLSKEIKWVAFGGSYPGSLAAWMRLKYPHLIHAAVSSSAPLLAKVDFREYFQVVKASIKAITGNDDCNDQVQLALEQIRALIKVYPNIIEQKFKISHIPFNCTENEINSIIDFVFESCFSGAVQYYSPDYDTVTKKCDKMKSSKDEMAFEKLAKIYIKQSEEVIRLGNNRDLESNADSTWEYQMCTEFGFFQAHAIDDEMFSDDYFSQACRKYNSNFDMAFMKRSVDWTNAAYGGLDIAASRIVSIHGSLDPWHALGITESANKDMPAILINGTSHCANMLPEKDSDPEELKNARIEVAHYLSVWLAA